MAVRATLCLAAMLLVCLEDKVIGPPGPKHECTCTTNQLVECDINPRFSITKKNEHYYLTIWLCSNDQCPGVPQIEEKIRWKDCEHNCEHCQFLTGQDCGSDTETACEQTLDAFLNNFCKNTILATCPRPGITPSRSNQATETLDATMTISPTYSQPDIRDVNPPTLYNKASISYSQSRPLLSVSYQPECTCTPSAVSTERSSSLDSSLELNEKSIQTTCTNSVTALGVLLALAVVLLAVATTGWVCTCLIMKKRQDPAQKRKNVDINTEDDKGDERIFQNPTYGETSATQQLTFSSVGSPDQGEQENFPEVMYDAVKLPTSKAATENGKTYDVLNRGQTDGSHQAKKDMERSSTTSDQNYSKLGLHD